MELFLNSADIGEIKDYYQSGFIKGITTNPSLVSKTKKSLSKIAEEISSLVSMPISMQVVSSNPNIMYEQSIKLAAISENIIIKLPCNFDGYCTAKKLYDTNKIKVNFTLCFSTSQAIMAAACKAFYISLFTGRLDDMGNDGANLIAETRKAYLGLSENKPRILAASISNVKQVVEAFVNGADIATVGSTVLKNMCEHRLSVEGLANFKKDWDESGLTF